MMFRFFPGLLMAAVSATAWGQVVNDARTITHELRIQPIIFREAASEGGSTATYFGGEAVRIGQFVNTIWRQAGINVTFLEPETREDSFVYNGFPGDYSAVERPEQHLRDITGMGPWVSDPTLLTMFFVGIVPGFEETSTYNVNALSFADANGVAIFVGQGLLTFDQGIEMVATTVARQIGLNLGLETLSGGENLMQPLGSPNAGHRITEAQIAAIFDDSPGELDGYDMLVPVPEPSVGLFALMALGFAGRRKRR